MARKLVVAVTGTPATGKSAFAKELARAVAGSQLIEINDVVNKYRLYSGKDRFGSKIVNLGRLGRQLKSDIRASKGHAVIIVGHLAQELSLRYDIAVVTRASLALVAQREEERRYHKEKIRENLIAEALDYCGSKMAKACKETYEVEKDRDKEMLKRYIAARAVGIPAKKPRLKEINEFAQMFKMIKAGNRYGF